MANRLSPGRTKWAPICSCPRGLGAGWAMDPGALDYLGRVIYAQARTLGFQDAFFHICFAFVLALVPAWFLGRAGRRSPAVERIRP